MIPGTGPILDCGLQVTEEEGTVFAPQTTRLSCGSNGHSKTGVCVWEGGGGVVSIRRRKKVFSISNSVPITLKLR